MKRIITQLSFVLIAVALAPKAGADLLIEPYLGYAMGSWSRAGINPNMSGVDYGARLGYQSFGFQVGGDYMGGSGTDNATPANTITFTDYGVFVGYKFPILLRAYGEYVFSSKPTFRSSAATYAPNGNAIKLGVGYTGLPFIAINFEYYAGTYPASGLATAMTDKTYGVSVSLPLTF